MKIRINENERGLRFRKGKYAGILLPGEYRIFRGSVQTVSLSDPLVSEAPLKLLLRDPAVAREISVFEVKEGEIGLHFVNGIFEGGLTAGEYAFWTVYDRHEVTICDLSEPQAGEEIPASVFKRLPASFYTGIDVAEYQKACLFYDNRFIRLLDAGKYYFWNGKVKVTVKPVDCRLLTKELTGQEILTLDKVALRINFVVTYRIADYVKVLTEIDDYEEQLHVAAQLALRDYVGRYRFDELLENKDGISAYVLEKLKEKEHSLWLTVCDAGVKDIILPGEVRDIMNTVLIAEKKAQANVIARREEVASTRSLLNTAKLMDENKTLYKLKEVEYLEKICEKVGNITVDGNGNLLSRLTAVLSGEPERPN